MVTNGRGADGSPSWLLHDRPRNRFFRLGWAESEMLRRWPPPDQSVLNSAQLAACINQESTLRISEGHVQKFVAFLTANQLVQPQSPQEVALLRAELQKKNPWWRWLLHHYLFVTIPLLHPDRFLETVLKHLPWVVWPAFFWGGIGLGLVGVYLVSRRWDLFLNTFPHLFSWQGALISALAVMVAKGVHELGHALVAKSHGCRIPSMGVAMLVMWPVLYADTTDVWRLPSRTQRLQVAAAGMAAEVLLAGWATLLWNFTDPGPLQSALLVLATVSWLTALLVNGNPLMRFDGYFFLSDWLEVPNLQERAFALGRWQLRRLLLGIPDAPPERFSRERQRLLIVFAWAVWCYRFFLFLGIALLVYHFFFKVLGLFLMLVEIGWFILYPVLRELRVWMQVRSRVPRGSVSLLALFLLAGLLLLCLPWRGSMGIPAVLRAQEVTTLYPPMAAQVVAVHVQAGQSVARGERLVTLASPDLEQQFELNRLDGERYLLESQRAGVTAEDREQRLIAVRLLAAARTQRQGLERLREQLQVVAPFAGVVDPLAEGIAPGRWVGREQPLVHLHQPGAVEIRAYVDETRHRQLRVGDRGTFFPNDLALEGLPVQVVEVDPSALVYLEWPFLASVYGGALAVRPDESGRLVPEEALYRVRLRLDTAQGSLPASVLLGEVSLPGGEESIAAGVWRSIVANWVRESGF